LKRAWVDHAVKTRFIGPRKLVRDGQALSPGVREELVTEADRWAALWNRHLVRMRAADLGGAVEAKLSAALQEDIQAGGFKVSPTHRALELGWNDDLAEAARAFHQKSEEAAEKGEWKDKAFIFYSLALDPTTLGVEAQLLGSESHDAVGALPGAAGKSLDEILESVGDGSLVPPPEQPFPEIQLYEHWRKEGSRYSRDRYKLVTVTGRLYGDGTVPIGSLLGFGGVATVFKKLLLDDWPERRSQIGSDSSGNTLRIDPNAIRPFQGPGHVQAPNHPWLWERIIDVLQGTLHNIHMEYGVDTRAGTLSDDSLGQLRGALTVRSTERLAAGIPDYRLDEW